MSIFDKIITDAKSGGWQYTSESINFQEYRRQSNPQLSSSAPRYISIQDYEHLIGLAPSGLEMVLRMGRGNFVLLRGPTQDSIKDFFLLDDDIFQAAPPVNFPVIDFDGNLLSFKLLSTLSEANAVNLALASGLLGHALGLDEPFPKIAPATGMSSYSFYVRPNQEVSKVWFYDRGSVEIDTCFIAKRNGRASLFILEAKSSKKAQVDRDSSLAKHKIVYPIMSLSKYVPKEIDICPVYLRSWMEDGYPHYSIVECNYPDPRQFSEDSPPAITALEPTERRSVCRLELDFESI